MNWVDRWGLDTTVIVVREENGLFHAIGAHTAVHVDNPNGDQVLFDPGGDYGNSFGTSSDQHWGDEYGNLDVYIDYHTDQLGEVVETYTVDTTPEQEEQIADNIANMPSTINPGGCVGATCEVINTVDPFQDVHATLPVGVGSDMAKIPGVQKETYNPCEKAGE